MMDIESLFLEICEYIEEKSEYFDIFIKFFFIATFKLGDLGEPKKS